MKEEGSVARLEFCPVPFENFEVLWNGDVYLCCSAWVPFPIGNLKKQTARSIWNSQTAAAIRKSVLDGDYRFCDLEYCAYFKSGALPEKGAVEDPYLREVIRSGITRLARGPARLTLDIDRTCNLCCPSCRTAPFMLKGGDYREALLMQNKLRDELLGDIRLMTVSGSGDPFASKLHMELLAGLDYRQYPKLKIQIMTNGLLFTPDNWIKISRAHRLVKNVIVSIDAATPETYRTVRRGGDFGVLVKNLGFISGLRKAGRLDRLEFHFVVQLANYLEMKDFVALGRTFGADLVSFSRLCNWGTFTPEEFKARAVHLRDHPGHQIFLEILKDPAFRDPLVNMSSLSEFI